MTQTQAIFRIPRASRLVQYIRARVRSLDIEIATVRAVLNDYGLTLAKPPRNLAVGRRSHNIVVDTSAGRKVLKRYRPEWQIPTIVYGHSIVARLAELGFPAPRLVARPGGSAIDSRDGQNYALFDFVEGTDYGSSYLPRAHWLSLVTCAGQTLARLHRQLEGFVPQGHHHLGFRSYTEDRERDLAWYAERLVELKEKSQRLARPEDRARANWLIQNTALMVEELHRLEEILRAAPLPRLVIHGDYAIRNLLFQRDGTVTVLDFELARLEWRLSDLVTSLARFRSATGAADFAGMRCFVAAYQAEYPMSADEWRYLPQVWRFRRIQRAVLFWRSYFEADGGAHHLVSAREAVNQADWALHHQSELLALHLGYS